MEYNLINLFGKYINESKIGLRTQKNGKKIRKSSIENYLILKNLLIDFSHKKEFKLRLKSIKKLKTSEIKREKKYWSDFYHNFTEYLYTDCNCFDNYVGSNIKLLRGFFNYLVEEKGIDIGSFYKKFYAPHEEIEIITLLPEYQHFLIHNKEFEDSLPEHLKRTKDIFNIGCTLALRVSDLFRISWNNIEKINQKMYLRISSQKTNTFSRILIPDYASEILNKYNDKNGRIFPTISNNQFNKNIKQLILRAGWTHEHPKTRQRRGIPINIYKNTKNKECFRYCDLITSHTMRRTAITNMLSMNMSENAVRQISGHAPNSKEFYRYVKLSQTFMDTEIESFHEKLKKREFVTS